MNKKKRKMECSCILYSTHFVVVAVSGNLYVLSLSNGAHLMCVVKNRKWFLCLFLFRRFPSKILFLSPSSSSHSSRAKEILEKYKTTCSCCAVHGRCESATLGEAHPNAMPLLSVSNTQFFIRVNCFSLLN